MRLAWRISTTRASRCKECKITFPISIQRGDNAQGNTFSPFLPPCIPSIPNNWYKSPSLSDLRSRKMRITLMPSRLIQNGKRNWESFPSSVVSKIHTYTLTFNLLYRKQGKDGTSSQIKKQDRIPWEIKEAEKSIHARWDAAWICDKSLKKRWAISNFSTKYGVPRWV